MDPSEEQQIIDEILKDRRLSYSFEILEVDGEKIVIRNNFGSTITYYKKGNHYLLEEEL